MNTSTSPKAQYAYSEMPSGANHPRLSSITYPNGRVITYNYAAGLASDISRLSSISDGGTTLEGFDYLGLGTIVRRAHPEAGVDLTYIRQGMESDGDAGDKYTGLDRFGRVVDQRWLKTSNGSHVDRFQYGYDRNGNRLYEQNLVDAAFSELYHANGASNGYDQLNQLTAFRRGVLSDTNSDGIPDTVSSPSRTQEWLFDPLGNWTTLTTNGTAQSRTHNRQNQITSITSLTTPSYDANGNMTGDENGKTLVYDAWNRLVDYKNGSTSLEAYQYDALGRRVQQGSTALYYSADWQVIEERDGGGIARVSMVWSPVYIDAMIARDRDADVNGSLEERLYVAHDANFNVSSILNTGGSTLERFILAPYGSPTFLNGSWSAIGASAYSWTHLHQGGRFSSGSGLYVQNEGSFSATLGYLVAAAASPGGKPALARYRNQGGPKDPLGDHEDAYMPPREGDLIIRGCDYQGAKPLPWKEIHEYCKKRGATSPDKQFCDHKSLCDYLSTVEGNGAFGRLFLVGHCGGKLPPGVRIGNQSRLTCDSLSEECKREIKRLVRPGGTVVLCACGYRNELPPGDFDKELSCWARVLGLRVCACDSKMEVYNPARGGNREGICACYKGIDGTRGRWHCKP